MKSKSRSKMWECGQCDKEFKYESEKRRHEQSHVPQFECKVCSKKFSFQSALRRHEKQHERKGSVRCSDCGGKFKDDTLLKRHIQYAHKGTFRCTKCNSSFSSELALRTHTKTHKPKSERRFHCSYEGCEKAFNFRHHLKHHELTHTDDKQYFCEECGKGFIQSHHLKIHQKIHEPESWLSCSVLNCIKKFANNHALKRHESTHKNKTAHIISVKNQKHTDANVKVMALCVTCNQLFTRRTYKKHIATCAPEDNKEMFETALQNLQITEQDLDTDVKLVDDIDVFDQADIPLEQKEIQFDQKGIQFVQKNIQFDQKDIQFNQKDIQFDQKDIQFEKNDVCINEINKVDDLLSPVSNCKSALGGCIVTGSQEINDNCLCAQITTVDTADDYDNIDLSRHSISLPKDDLKCIDKCRKDANACEHSICRISNISDIIIKESQMPVFEFRADGIVKIKDTFDIDIVDAQVLNKNQNIDSKIDFKTVNTCKDVLGKCMVSGNGTMGEGCLCARMTADDQQMIAQEIEEITPCPKNTWLSQRL